MDTRHPLFREGYRCCTRDAVTWLHNRATEMNDPQARAVLNVAANTLGGSAKRNRGWIVVAPGQMADKEVSE